MEVCTTDAKREGNWNNYRGDYIGRLLIIKMLLIVKPNYPFNLIVRFDASNIIQANVKSIILI